MPRLRRAFAVLALGLSACGSAPRHEPAPLPDIVVVMVDDLGWQDLGVAAQPSPTPLHAAFATPHVDRLVREGVRFDQAYAAAPVCTPTRVSLMTGQLPARHHVSYWTLHGGQDTSSRHPRLLPPDWRVDGLDAEAPTLADRLAERGYRTIHVGKAHFGATGTAAADPAALGFEVAIAGHAAGAPGSYRGTERFMDSLRKGRPAAASVWDVPGLEAWHGRDVDLTDVLAEEARRALRTALADARPVFLHFAPYAVHTPITANPRTLARFTGLDPIEAAYASMVASVDDALGVLLDELAAAGRLERAIVVLTSDNGGLSAVARGGVPHGHNAPLRSGKGSAYEGGLRVPCIVRWPSVARPGTRCDTPIVTMDLTATLLAAAGARPLPALDGEDLAPLLRGEPISPTRPLFWHMPHLWGPAGPGLEPFTSLREGPLKLVFFHDGSEAAPRLELYDLLADPGESRDLATERPVELARLTARLTGLARAVGAQPSRRRVDAQDLPWPE
jgi:arylsulfatase A-like enzyme